MINIYFFNKKEQRKCNQKATVINFSKIEVKVINDKISRQHVHSFTFDNPSQATSEFTFINIQNLNEVNIYKVTWN